MPEGVFKCIAVNFGHTLDKTVFSQYNILAIGAWRSLVSRLVRVQEAAGSSPAAPTKNPVTTFVVAGFLIGQGLRKGGTSVHTGAKIESWRAIFSPWENPLIDRRIQYGCG